MEHINIDIVGNAGGPVMVFGPTPDGSDADWEVARQPPGGVASNTLPSQDAPMDVDESRNSQSSTKKNRAGKISREVRDIQESIQSLSQDVAGKADSTEVKEALSKKVDRGDFQELATKVDNKADISQVEILRTVANEKGNKESSQDRHSTTDSGQLVPRNCNKNGIENMFKQMTAGIAGAAFCASGLAILCCLKQKLQIDQLHAAMNAQQKATEDLEGKKLELMLEGYYEADYEYVQTLESQLTQSMSSLYNILHSSRPSCDQWRKEKENARCNRIILEISKLLKPIDLTVKALDGYGHGVGDDTELTSTAKQFNELVQRMAKSGESPAVNIELTSEGKALQKILQERKEQWAMRGRSEGHYRAQGVPLKYMYRALHRSRM